MSLNPNRTTYEGNPGKVFHVVPAGTGTAYDDLVLKYGGYYVYKFDVGGTFFNTIQGRVLNGRNDHILFYPGTYANTTTLTVSKACTIQSASGNPASTFISHGAAPVAGFTVTGDGVTIKNLTFLGADGGSAGVTNTGDGLLVEGCVFDDSDLGVLLAASDGCIIKNNIFESDNAAAIGVDVGSGGTAAVYVKVYNNSFDLSGGSTSIGVKVDNAALNCTIKRNSFHTDIADPISPGTQAGNADTDMSENTQNGETTAAWIVT